MLHLIAFGICVSLDWNSFSAFQTRERERGDTTASELIFHLITFQSAVRLDICGVKIVSMSPRYIYFPSHYTAQLVGRISNQTGDETRRKRNTEIGI